MTPRPVWTTSDLLWLTAFLGLILASVTSHADDNGVAALASCGALFCIVVGIVEPRESIRSPGQSWPGFAVLGIAGGLEFFGWMSLRDDSRSPGIWYAVALAQALAAAMLARRREPRDGMFLGVIAFHAILNVPTAALILLNLLRSSGLPDDPRSATTSIVMQMMGMAGVVMLPLFVCLGLTLVLLESQQPAQERHMGWWVHVVGLVATAIILARWSVRGL